LVTHGVSHLNKCDNIIVLSQGEIVDQGSYNDLMTQSKILQNFVHSTATSSTEQHPHRTSSVVLETQTSVPMTPLELIPNSFQINDDGIQQETLQTAAIEIEDEQKKLIQKETIQTGSVGSLRY
jgi:ABC-type methionine transport system ATPase subunit